MQKIKLYTYIIDTFYTYKNENENENEIKSIVSKEYAVQDNTSCKDDIGNYVNFCTPIFTSYKRAAKYAESECDYWYYILEYDVSLKQLEDIIDDNHDEKTAKLHKVHSVVYCPDVKKYKRFFNKNI